MSPDPTAPDPVAARLAEIRERYDAAAELPLDSITEFGKDGTRALSGWIAESALDVPALLGAVEAVLALHQPENFVLGVKPCPVHRQWSGSLMAVIDDRRQCPDCVVTEYDTCGHCLDVDEGYNWRWPCPTYRDLSAALLGEKASDG